MPTRFYVEYSALVGGIVRPLTRSFVTLPGAKAYARKTAYQVGFARVLESNRVVYSVRKEDLAWRKK